jgi:3-methylfumaryl-CoA hydratase
MADLITPEIRAWIGRSEAPTRVEVTRRDIVKYAIATEQRLERYRNGDEAPPMFTFGAFREVVPLERLGPDGLARQSLLPDLPLKRVMAGGYAVRCHRPVRPGDVLVGRRTLVDIFEKQGASGRLIFLVYELKIESEDGEPVVDETQTRIVR